MRCNMGAIDRGVRLIAGIVITILLAARVLSGAAAIVLGIIAVILLFSSLTGFCLLYIPFKISTKKQG